MKSKFGAITYTYQTCFSETSPCESMEICEWHDSNALFVFHMLNIHEGEGLDMWKKPTLSKMVLIYEMGYTLPRHWKMKTLHGCLIIGEKPANLRIPFRL